MASIIGLKNLVCLEGVSETAKREGDRETLCKEMLRQKKLQPK